MFHKVDNIFKITSIGYPLDRIFSADFDFKGEQHNFIEIVYLLSGNVEIVENDKVYMLSSGDMLIHAPMEFHRIRSSNDSSPHVLNLSISVDGTFPKELFDGVFTLSPTQHAEYLKYFKYVEEIEIGSECKSCLQMAADGISAVLLDMAHQCKANDVLSTQSSALLYKHLVNDMEKAVYTNISVDELARAHFISTSYVKKLFRTYANTSPKFFFNSLRIKEAAFLLNKGLTAAEIADKMNFSSPNYFSVFFKSHTGQTPAKFQRSIAKSTTSHIEVKI